MVSQDKRATVQPDRAICDRQPHPGTAGFIGARRVYPIEGHTQGGDLVFWNTGPKISNGKSYSSCAVRALALKCHDHICSCMSVSNSVSHHVLNRTGKQLRMCMNCNPVRNGDFSPTEGQFPSADHPTSWAEIEPTSQVVAYVYRFG